MKNTHDDNEIAANLRVVISRMIKILRSGVKHDKMLWVTERERRFRHHK